MKNTELLLNQLKKKFEGMGFGSQDPVINNVLGVFSNASFSARSESDIALVEGKIEALLNLDPETLKRRLNLRREQQINEQEMQEYINEKQEELVIAEDRKQDKEQNQNLVDLNKQKEQEEQEEEQDLFLLHKLGKDQRLQVREELEERNLQDRQRSLMERNLKILEALGKIRDAMKQEKGMLEIGGEIFKGLNAREIKQQLGLLKAMGVQEVSRDENGNIVENEGRQINVETITENDIDDIEKGKGSFAISFKDLQSIQWKMQSERVEKWLAEKGITKDKIDSVKVRNDEGMNIEPLAQVTASRENDGWDRD